MPTIIWSTDFEAGVASGTAMTKTNSAFTQFVGSAWTFSNAHLLTQGGGALAGRVVTTTSTNSGATPGPAAYAATSSLYYRFYVYPEKLPSVNVTILSVWNSSSVVTAELRHLTSGALQIRNNANIQVAVSGAVATTGTQVRVECYVDSSTDKQQLKLFVGSNVHGTTPDYDSGLLSSATGGTASTGFNFGIVSSAIAGYDFDNLAFSNNGWIGPVVSANLPPTVTTGPDQTNVEPWKLVTLTGTASDPDGTVSSLIWSQVSGTSVQLFSDSALTTPYSSGGTVYYIAPATIRGDTGQFKLTATDNLGASTSASVNVTSYPVTERAAVGGIEVPMRITTG